MTEPTGLGERGLAIYRNYVTDTTDAARAALALEAARTADRLDELDSIIQGKGVLNLMQFRVLDNEIMEGAQTIEVEVKFQSVLSEARMQGTALTGLLKNLGLEGSAGEAKPVQPATAADALAAKREERRKAREARQQAK